MAEKISGKIQYLNERDGKFGKSYNYKIDGETYYLKGKFPPRGVAQGDEVELEWEYNGNYKTVVNGTVRKVEAGSSSAKQSSAPQKFKAGTSNDDRQTIISKQAALNTALAFLELAAKTESIPVPKQKNAGYGYLRTLMLTEAANLFKLNTGEEWDVSDFLAVDEEAPKPVKKAAPKKQAEPEPEPAWGDDDFSDDDIPF